MNAQEFLKSICRPGTTVYCKIGSVSHSGMSRQISLYVVDKKTKRLISISWHVAQLLSYKLGSSGGVKIGGCGMDMGFALVNRLSYALHGKLSKGADAIAAEIKGVPLTPIPGHFRSGYSLKHEWI